MKPLRSAAILRGYAWWLLRENLEWSVDDYGGRVPIVPFSDEPVLQTYEKPYVVYGYAEGVDKTDHRQTTGMMTFSFRTKNLSDINLAMRCLIEGFKREDESAADVNQYSSDVDDYFSGLNFTCIEVPYIEPGSPEESDESRIEGNITISYTYVDHYGDQPDADGVKLRDSVFSA